KLKLLHIATAFLAANLASAQVLYSENFDNLTIGDLSTDLTGLTPGQGGWYVNIKYPSGQAKIVSELNRGNVLTIGTEVPNPVGNTLSVSQIGLANLWDNRSLGNDILLIEYDYYITRVFETSNHSRFVFYADNNNILFRLFLESSYFSSFDINNLTAEYTDSGLKYFSLGTNGSNVYTNAQYDTWVSVKLCMDYTTGKTYVYIPSFQILAYGTFSHNMSIDNFLLNAGLSNNSNIPESNKYDNIRISALKTLPSYLGIDDFITTKFNIFPNPVTDIVTISNAENITIEEIVVYDMNGSIIKSQDGKKTNEIQLNIEDFASGIYMLYIKTSEGVAAKKIVKK